MKVLVLAGPESSGKSWLSSEIHANFGGILVGEYVRHFIESEARETCYDDIASIAHGQLRWEDEARARQPHLLILDTHLLSNILWSQTLFGACPTWIEQALLTRHYDLHLLLSPETVAWHDDGQRCQPQLAERQAFFQASRQWLDLHHRPCQVLQGDWQQRKDAAFDAVTHLLTT
ncbi:nicotinamide riboside kinase [Pseudomonas sp. 478]|uniref:AAA family ATPase n=1 Tax=unclassified Pseudomonas TaxID=196821 RepID=UPI000DAB46F6|nr:MULTISPECIES: AAA family ATPase [unclassified Pseudomonas]PZW97162.1 nicotinamide riboside kinase [Pseudomonas sp. 478]TCV54663.1 nicotinamide riboside kinase [Pseudomonas sp. 460]